jgi:hypothetical protein
MMEIKRLITNKFDFDRQVSIAPLIMFRMIFGALMLFGILRFISKGWVEQLYIAPDFYFGYLGFEWVTPLPGNWMYAPFVVMVISALFIILGFRYHLSAFLFFLCFTYVELLDKSNYLNHYYFVSLMSFLMIWVPANRDFSIDSWRNPELKKTQTNAWHIGILKFQLAVVYIFAGIAKINSDWLFDAQPLKIWLQAHHQLPAVGEYLQQEWVAYAFSWFGCIYDLFIVFFLLNCFTRPIAYFFVIAFHFITWYLFPIGVFPWVMIFSTLIFFSPELHQAVLNKLKSISKSVQAAPSIVVPKTHKWVKGLLVGYICLQILIPFRYVLYPGDLFWNEEGFRFSWRVMLMHKEGHATFYVRDPKTGREKEIDNSMYLNNMQIDQMATQTDMILQFAHFLFREFNGKTLHYGDNQITLNDPSIHAEVYVSLNGRPAQLFINKSHNLAELKYNLSYRNWLEPFTK